MLLADNIVVTSLQVLLAFVFLIWSADRFVTGAVVIANRLQVTPLLIGLTVVAIGTSAPEIFVAIISAINGYPEIGIGNAVGSNIANIGLVLGATALVGTIYVRRELLFRELPIFIGVNIACTIVLWDKQIGKVEGGVLLIIYIVSFAWLIWRNIRDSDKTIVNEEIAELEEKLHTVTENLALGVFWLLFGLVLLPLSSHFLVAGAAELARWFGVSDFIIGLTIVAIGTSLPELATSLISLAKGHHDLVVGNVLGSNIANLTLVLGPIGLIRNTTLPANISRDLAVMLGFSLLLVVLALRKRKELEKLEGGLLLLGFIGYMALVITC